MMKHPAGFESPYWQELDDDWGTDYVDGYEDGAAVAFGIIGMAEAIRDNAPRVVKREYWTSEIYGTKYYDCWCPGCGTRMNTRDAGVDEGTYMEWCGPCRETRVW